MCSERDIYKDNLCKYNQSFKHACLSGCNYIILAFLFLKKYSYYWIRGIYELWDHFNVGNHQIWPTNIVLRLYVCWGLNLGCLHDDAPSQDPSSLEILMIWPCHYYLFWSVQTFQRKISTSKQEGWGKMVGVGDQCHGSQEGCQFIFIFYCYYLIVVETLALGTSYGVTHSHVF